MTIVKTGSPLVDAMNAHLADPVRELTDEQLEEISKLNYNDLEDSVYFDYLDNLGAGSDFSEFDEAYCGEFESDEAFAQDMAEQLGDAPELFHWPYRCIDWKWAGRELMMDYYELDGHYFRNL